MNSLVPWEEGIPVAHKLKQMKYSDWAAKCRDLGWAATLHPVEVGHRGFMGSSATQPLRAVGLAGANLQKAIKEVAEEAEKPATGYG